MMNLPKDHPARDMQQLSILMRRTYLERKLQGINRVLEKHDFSKGPLKMVNYSKVYRRILMQLTLINSNKWKA